MIRVAVIPERYGAVFSPCGSIRLSAFFDALKKAAGIEVRYVLLPELERQHADVIVWQRVALPTKQDVGTLVRIASASGARLVYDLDDNLLDIAGHGEEDAYAGMVAAVRASLRAAHEVWVSTPRLAERVAGETRGNIIVLPNALDPGLWSGRTHGSASGTRHLPFRMLYMGTRTHDEDFGMLDGALERLHAQMPGDFELTMIGVCAGDLRERPWLRALNPPPHVGASYPAFVHWFSRLEGFDLGLAPLVAGPFNDFKSSIKVLDYAALGLPTLASDVHPYRDPAMVPGSNVFLVANTIEAWAGHIKALMNDAALLHQVRNAALTLVGPDPFMAAMQARGERLVQQFDLKEVSQPSTAMQADARHRGTAPDIHPTQVKP